jgi:HAMP domain-containing protein
MVGTLVLIVLMIGQAILGISVLRETRQASSALAHDTMPSIRLLGEIVVEATRYRLRASRHAAMPAPEKMAEIDGPLHLATVELGDRFVRYARLISDERERSAWQAFLDDWGSYVLHQEQALAASRRGDKTVAADLIEDGRDLFLATMGRLSDEIAVYDTLTRHAEARVDRSYRDAMAGVAISGGVAVLCALLVWFWIARPVVKRLEELTVATNAVASGALATPVPALERRDEIGDMARALVVFRDGLAEAERARELQAALDRANLSMMNQAQEELTFKAEFLDREVEAKKVELLAREREIVWRLSRATERRDNETGDHIVRMATISGIIADSLGMSAEECALIEIAAQMHDIGKVGIPDHILFKAGPLTPDERRTMETHALIGWNILKGSDSRLIRMAADVRSEERRVGKECRRLCRSRWSPYH